MTHLDQLYDHCKEIHLKGRYVTNDSIAQLLKKLPDFFEISEIGQSVEERSIFMVKAGKGEKRILMWSQMHGNESTSTKAVIDLFNALQIESVATLLKTCTLYVIPILNPDGANMYTRTNANNIDLNRDAQNLSQPESVSLRHVFDTFKPHYCFNLHGQRTIFSAGPNNKPATLSFLSPSVDQDRTKTASRKIAMQLISEINLIMQASIPNQIGRYDDSFNINCVGDTFQSLGVPTVLFEAGHFENDYGREMTRKYMFMALLNAIKLIANTEITGETYKAYFSIPENHKMFYDIIVREAKINADEITDIAIQYEESLQSNGIEFIPKVKVLDKLKSHYGHREIQAHGQLVTSNPDKILAIDSQVDVLKVGVDEFSLKFTIS